MITSSVLIFLWGSCTYEIQFTFLLGLCLMSVSLSHQPTNLGRSKAFSALTKLESLYRDEFRCGIMQQQLSIMRPDCGGGLVFGLFSGVRKEGA